MISNSMKLIVYLALFILVSGCATLSPLKEHFENNFSDFKTSKEKMVKVTTLKKDYRNSFDEVWDSTLYILAQHAIIVDTSRESGVITYVDIDGVYFKNVFTEDKFLYWDFSFTVWIEEANKGTTVYIYPMTGLYSEKDLKKQWWKIVEKGFNQKGEEILTKLSTQLTAKERWPWLRN